MKRKSVRFFTYKKFFFLMAIILNDMIIIDIDIDIDKGEYHTIP